MKKIAYIHFSDLHIGQKYANQYLSNAKDIVLQDPEKLQNDIGVNKDSHIRFRIYRLVPLQEVHLHCC